MLLTSKCLKLSDFIIMANNLFDELNLVTMLHGYYYLKVEITSHNKGVIFHIIVNDVELLEDVLVKTDVPPNGTYLIKSGFMFEHDFLISQLCENKITYSLYQATNRGCIIKQNLMFNIDHRDTKFYLIPDYLLDILK